VKKLPYHKIGLIGVGNMGASILAGVLNRRLALPSNVLVYDKDAEKSRAFSRKHRVAVAASTSDLLKRADVLLLAIKPQDFSLFALEHKVSFKPGQGVISILAGLTTEKIGKALGRNALVVRAMPNLGAKAGESMTVLCGKNKKWLSFAAALFSGCGEVVTLPEKTLDLVTAVSGSGPAYFFHLMELLEDFGVKRGLPKRVAAVLAVQTGLGAARVAKGAGVSCGELRKMVTSKKGTTEAALKTLQKHQFGKIFHRALNAAMKRSKELRR